MSYHDYGDYKTRWSTDDTEKGLDSTKRKQPRIQIISPQKQLYDIRQLVGDESELAKLTTKELATRISQIINYHQTAD